VHSWLRLAARIPYEFVCICPPGYEPDEGTVALAKAAGISDVTVTSDRNAVKGADVIYTDVWASMGQKETLEVKMRDFAPYQVPAHRSPPNMVAFIGESGVVWMPRASSTLG
jgi:ornithine carbamoyltransferase